MRGSKLAVPIMNSTIFLNMKCGPNTGLGSPPSCNVIIQSKFKNR